MNNSAQKIVKTTAAIVGGNLHSLGIRTSRKLVDGGVMVNYFSSTTSSEDLVDSTLYGNSNFIVGVSKNLYVGSGDLAYVFYFIDPAHTFEVFQKTVDLTSSSGAKFTLITPTPHKSTHQYIKSSEIEDSVNHLLSQTTLNYRIIYLNHLFGPGVDPNDPSQLSLFYAKLTSGKYIIPDEQSEAYPLYIDDVPDAILKATFSPSTNKKIYHLAGEKTNLVDFCYAIRSGLQHNNLIAKTLDIQKINPPPSLDDVLTTQSELNWHPKTIFEQANAQTINWFLNHPEIKSQLFSIIKKPNLKFPSHKKTESEINPLAEQETNIKPLENLETKTDEIQTTISLHQDPLDSWEIRASRYQSLLSLSHAQTESTTQESVYIENNTEIKNKIDSTKNSWVSDNLKKISERITNTNHHQSIKTDTPTHHSNQNHLSNTPKIFKTNTKTLENPKTLKIMAYVLAGLLVISTPLIILIITFTYTLSVLSATKDNLTSFDIKTATQNAIKAEKGIDLIDSQLKIINPALNLILGKYAASNIIELVDIAGQGTSIITNLTSTNQSSSSLMQHVIKGGGDLNKLIADTQVSTNSTYHKISALEAKLKSSNHLTSIKTFGIGSAITKTQTQIQKYKKYIDQGRQLTDILPTLLAENSKKTYLILLQNNAELRPTGGFIGSYALVTFQNGTMLDLKVEDVYTADGQLKGYVEPPEPIKRYLGEASWYLRDSNWDPNFPTSAARAAWFLEKELGVKVDGVVGINLYAIQKLLEVTGPINLVDFDETITAENIFERAQFQIELNQFPGSTQKKDFIGKLTKGLIEKLMTSDDLTWYQTIFKLTELASQNQLTIALNDKNAMETIKDIGWSGEILSNPCLPVLKSPTCVSDYLAVIDANLSVNKVNYFIDRNVVYQPNIDTFGFITSDLIITISNTSPDATWPGGVYHNYSRIYTPLGTKLQTIKINGVNIDQNQITTSIESGKTVFGFINVTNPGEKTTINLTYTLPEKLPLGSPTAYQLLVQKQSGTKSDPITTNITYPDGLQPAITLPEQLLNTGVITHTSTLDRNQTLAVEFARTF